MNPAVPSWLRHLRTDRRGLLVPYINMWGPEDIKRVAIRYDPIVRDRAVFVDDEGQTEPDFTRQNMQRQRECAMLGLCQVCRRQIPWSRRFLVVADMSVSKVHVESLGRDVPVITEPWLDERCARFALDHCPALIRRRRDENLTLVPVTSSRQVQTIVSRGWVDGPLAVSTKADPVVMWVKIALLHVGLLLSDAMTGG